MVAINFKKQFVEPIQNGTKTQTCREKNRFKVGDKLQLYYGMRTKQCKKIADAICTEIIPIRIQNFSNTKLLLMCFSDEKRQDIISAHSGDVFTREEGFNQKHPLDQKEAIKWFFPSCEKFWSGYLIKWKLTKL